MKLLIVSDIHGEIEAFKNIIAQETYDHLISLGDSELSVADLKPVGSLIHGNAMMDLGQALKVETFAGLKVIMTHGHLSKVHQGDALLLRLLSEHDAHMIMHGHTHVARFKKHGEHYILNPGAIYGPRGSWPSSYATLEIKDKTFIVTFKTLQQHIIHTEEGVLT
jgi:uncharacterized protein